MRYATSAIFAALSLGIVGFSHAAMIVVGDHPLLPNKANQTIQISVTEGDAVQGLNLYLQIADGGTLAGGSVNGPTITSVDILSNTIFSDNNTGVRNPGSLPQVAARVTTTSAGTVNAEGLLATLTIDTTGFTDGSWSLNLNDTLNGPTDFAGVPVVTYDGSIFIAEVPEPMSLLPLAMVVGLLRQKQRSLTRD
jgi:hypothetical protein